MALFGKLLAFLNVLAAGAFVYLAVADYGKRQTWAYAVFQHELAIDGLPLDEDVTDLDGAKITDHMTDKTVRFTGGQPVKTQKAEVERVRTQIKRAIDEAGNDQGKQRSLLLNYLVPLARTGAERDELKAKVRVEPIANLLANDGPLEKQFEAILKKNNDQGKEREPWERRLAIAHLLASHANDEAEYQRVLTVVGFKAYLAEANHQAAALQTMIDRMRRFMDEDRLVFEKEHRRLVEEIQVLTARVNDRGNFLKDQKELSDRHRVLVEARKLEVRALKDQLETVRKSLQDVLAKQKQEEKSLFAAEQGVEKATKDNLGLEREIRTLEKVEPGSERSLERRIPR